MNCENCESCGNWPEGMGEAVDVMDAGFASEFVRMADDGWRTGWHEANGGNLSYRLAAEELTQVEGALQGVAPGEWVPIGGDVAVPGLAGEALMVSAAGSHFRNMTRRPDACAGIIQLDDEGSRYRVLWGFANGGRPTSELPSHLLLHEAKRRASNGEGRVVYHAHPTNVNALTSVLPLEGDAFTRELWGAISECAIVFPNGLGVLGWMVPGTVELGRATAELMGKRDAVVWAHHGVICAGSTFDDAFGMLHTIEKASEVLVKVRSMQAEPASRITDANLREMSDAYDLGIRLATD